jgi:hypothetical protein
MSNKCVTVASVVSQNSWSSQPRKPVDDALRPVGKGSSRWTRLSSPVIPMLDASGILYLVFCAFAFFPLHSMCLFFLNLTALVMHHDLGLSNIYLVFDFFFCEVFFPRFLRFSLPNLLFFHFSHCAYSGSFYTGNIHTDRPEKGETTKALKMMERGWG